MMINLSKDQGNNIKFDSGVGEKSRFGMGQRQLRMGSMKNQLEDLMTFPGVFDSEKYSSIYVK